MTITSTPYMMVYYPYQGMESILLEPYLFTFCIWSFFFLTILGIYVRRLIDYLFPTQFHSVSPNGWVESDSEESDSEEDESDAEMEGFDLEIPFVKEGNWCIVLPSSSAFQPCEMPTPCFIIPPQLGEASSLIASSIQDYAKIHLHSFTIAFSPSITQYFPKDFFQVFVYATPPDHIDDWQDCTGFRHQGWLHPLIKNIGFPVYRYCPPKDELESQTELLRLPPSIPIYKGILGDPLEGPWVFVSKPDEFSSLRMPWSLQDPFMEYSSDVIRVSSWKGIENHFHRLSKIVWSPHSWKMRFTPQWNYVHELALEGDYVIIWQPHERIQWMLGKITSE